MYFLLSIGQRNQRNYSILRSTMLSKKEITVTNLLNKTTNQL